VRRAHAAPQVPVSPVGRGTGFGSIQKLKQFRVFFLPDFSSAAAAADFPFSFNTEAHLLPLTAPPPSKFIPLLSRSSKSSGAESPLPFTSSEHEEGGAALHVAAGTVAALLVGFYLCFRWRSGRCYQRQDRRAKKKD